MKTKKKPSKVSVNIRFSLAEYDLLKEVQSFYRSKSASHAIRLAIEDVAKRGRVDYTPEVEQSV